MFPIWNSNVGDFLSFYPGLKNTGQILGKCWHPWEAHLCSSFSGLSQWPPQCSGLWGPQRVHRLPKLTNRTSPTYGRLPVGVETGWGMLANFKIS